MRRNTKVVIKSLIIFNTISLSIPELNHSIIGIYFTLVMLLTSTFIVVDIIEPRV